VFGLSSIYRLADTPVDLMYLCFLKIYTETSPLGIDLFYKDGILEMSLMDQGYYFNLVSDTV